MNHCIIDKNIVKDYSGGGFFFYNDKNVTFNNLTLTSNVGSGEFLIGGGM